MLLDQRHHVANRHFEPDERGARDDVMADVQLFDLLDCGDGTDVAIVQRVPGGDLQPAISGVRGCLLDFRQLGE